MLLPDVIAVHSCPDRERAVVVAPEDVAPAVSVEIVLHGDRQRPRGRAVKAEGISISLRSVCETKPDRLGRRRHKPPAPILEYFTTTISWKTRGSLRPIKGRWWRPAMTKRPFGVDSRGLPRIKSLGLRVFAISRSRSENCIKVLQRRP
jgi:hypothetical protein